ncbi:MAG: hypothetical protein ACKPKO_54370, partial [Candidatus Fonsibacter sp.]
MDNLPLKANQLTTYTKVEVDGLVPPNSDKNYVDTQLALKADQLTTYTKTEVQQLFLNLIDDAPASLDTLNELATALANDANFATNIQNQIALKASITYVDG